MKSSYFSSVDLMYLSVDGASPHARPVRPYVVNSRSEENFIRNTSIFGAWNTAYSMEYVEYGWNTGGIRQNTGLWEVIWNTWKTYSDSRVACRSLGTPVMMCSVMYDF